MQADRFTYTIQYQDVDEHYLLRLYTLENYLLNSAGLSADKHGFGVQYLHPQHLTWVITNMSLEMRSLPSPCDEMVVETWVEEHIHTLSVRNFRIYINGIIQGEARTLWAIINTDDRTIQSIFDRDVFDVGECNEHLDMQAAHRHTHISKFEESKLHRIAYSDVDYNGHCNSCKYLERMLDLHEPGGLVPFRLDLRYSREVYKNDRVVVGYAQIDGKHCYELYAPHGELCCSAILSAL